MWKEACGDAESPKTSSGYTFVRKLTLPGIGEAEEYSIQGSNQRVLNKTFLCQDKTELSRLDSCLSPLLKKKSLQEEEGLLPISSSGVRPHHTYCSTQWRVDVQIGINDKEVSLKENIHSRMGNAVGTNCLVRILKGVAQGIESLKRLGLSHNLICPGLIFVETGTVCGEVKSAKLMPLVGILRDPAQIAQMSIFNNQDIYFSPEIFDKLSSLSTEPSSYHCVDAHKADAFSLGMTLLQVGLSTPDIRKLYAGRTFDYGYCQQMLSSFSKRFPQNLVQAVTGLLHPQPRQRLTVGQAAKMIVEDTRKAEEKENRTKGEEVFKKPTVASFFNGVKFRKGVKVQQQPARPNTARDRPLLRKAAVESGSSALLSQRTSNPHQQQHRTGTEVQNSRSLERPQIPSFIQPRSQQQRESQSVEPTSSSVVADMPRNDGGSSSSRTHVSAENYRPLINFVNAARTFQQVETSKLAQHRTTHKVIPRKSSYSNIDQALNINLPNRKKSSPKEELATGLNTDRTLNSAREKKNTFSYISQRLTQFVTSRTSVISQAQQQNIHSLLQKPLEPQGVRISSLSLLSQGSIDFSVMRGGDQIYQNSTCHSVYPQSSIQLQSQNQSSKPQQPKDFVKMPSSAVRNSADVKKAISTLNSMIKPTKRSTDKSLQSAIESTYLQKQSSRNTPKNLLKQSPSVSVQLNISMKPSEEPATLSRIQEAPYSQPHLERPLCVETPLKELQYMHDSRDWSDQAEVFSQTRYLSESMRFCSGPSQQQTNFSPVQDPSGQVRTLVSSTQDAESHKVGSLFQDSHFGKKPIVPSLRLDLERELSRDVLKKTQASKGSKDRQIRPCEEYFPQQSRSVSKDLPRKDEQVNNTFVSDSDLESAKSSEIIPMGPAKTYHVPEGTLGNNLSPRTSQVVKGFIEQFNRGAEDIRSRSGSLSSRRCLPVESPSLAQSRQGCCSVADLGKHSHPWGREDFYSPAMDLLPTTMHSNTISRQFDFKPNLEMTAVGDQISSRTNFQSNEVRYQSTDRDSLPHIDNRWEEFNNTNSQYHVPQGVPTTGYASGVDQQYNSSYTPVGHNSSVKEVDDQRHHYYYSSELPVSGSAQQLAQEFSTSREPLALETNSKTEAIEANSERTGSLEIQSGQLTQTPQKIKDSQTLTFGPTFQNRDQNSRQEHSHNMIRLGEAQHLPKRRPSPGPGFYKPILSRSRSNRQSENPSLSRSNSRRQEDSVSPSINTSVRKESLPSSIGKEWASQGRADVSRARGRGRNYELSLRDAVKLNLNTIASSSSAKIQIEDRLVETLHLGDPSRLQISSLQSRPTQKINLLRSAEGSVISRHISPIAISAIELPSAGIYPEVASFDTRGNFNIGVVDIAGPDLQVYERQSRQSPGSVRSQESYSSNKNQVDSFSFANKGSLDITVSGAENSGRVSEQGGKGVYPPHVAAATSDLLIQDYSPFLFEPETWRQRTNQQEATHRSNPKQYNRIATVSVQDLIPEEPEDGVDESENLSFVYKERLDEALTPEKIGMIEMKGVLGAGIVSAAQGRDSVSLTKLEKLKMTLTVETPWDEYYKRESEQVSGLIGQDQEEFEEFTKGHEYDWADSWEKGRGRKRKRESSEDCLMMVDLRPLEPYTEALSPVAEDRSEFETDAIDSYILHKGRSARDNSHKSMIASRVCEEEQQSKTEVGKLKSSGFGEIAREGDRKRGN